MTSASSAVRVTGFPGAGPYALEMAVAMAAVRDASLVCRAVRAGFTPEQSVTKRDRSPVTVADLAAEAVISLALADALPGDPLMGEEDSRQLRDPAGSALAALVVNHVRAVHPGADLAVVTDALDRCADAGGPGRRWWTLDPVDGTKGFLRNEQYAIALGLVVDGEVAVGVLGCPNLARADRGVGCLFAAVSGGGAWELPLEGEGEARRLRVADVSHASDGRYAESIEAGHSAQDVSARIAERLGLSATPVRLDSQAKYAMVARGDASIYLRVPIGGYRENVWDHAPGWIVMHEAGGQVSDVDGLPLDFTAGRRLERNRGIVATPVAIHAQVVEAVRGVISGG